MEGPQTKIELDPTQIEALAKKGDIEALTQLAKERDQEMIEVAIEVVDEDNMDDFCKNYMNQLSVEMDEKDEKMLKELMLKNVLTAIGQEKGFEEKRDKWGSAIEKAKL